MPGAAGGQRLARPLAGDRSGHRIGWYLTFVALIVAIFVAVQHFTGYGFQSLPGLRQLAGAARLWRIRYVCAWRLWKYDVRYRDPETGHRMVSVREPLRLWWRGEFDRYVGRPLLAGRHARWIAEKAARAGFAPLTPDA